MSTHWFNWSDYSWMDFRWGLLCLLLFDRAIHFLKNRQEVAVETSSHCQPLASISWGQTLKHQQEGTVVMRHFNSSISPLNSWTVVSFKDTRCHCWVRQKKCLFAVGHVHTHTHTHTHTHIVVQTLQSDTHTHTHAHSQTHTCTDTYSTPHKRIHKCIHEDRQIQLM